MAAPSLTLDDILKALVDQQDGDLVVPLAAAEVCEQHAAIVDAWLAEQRVALVTQHLGYMVRSERGRATRRAPERRFAEAVAAGEAPPERALDSFYVVDGGGTQRRLRDMSSADCVFVADAYRDRARRHLFEEAVLRQIAKRVPAGKTVGEVIAEKDYFAIRKVVGERTKALDLVDPAA